jgi:hypothetical protein
LIRRSVVIDSEDEDKNFIQNEFDKSEFVHPSQPASTVIKELLSDRKVSPQISKFYSVI